MDDLEIVILENLIYNEDYTRKVIPFLSPEYFQETESKIVYEKILSHIGKYNALPTQSELIIEIKSETGLSQSDYEKSIDAVNLLTKKAVAPSSDWLIEKTEAFCKERAIYNAFIEGAELIDGMRESGIISLGDVPDKIQKALAISFDQSVGSDYSLVADRWERRKQRVVEKIPFCVEVFNEATNGGMNLKTVSCIAGGTGSGKSAFKCAQAAYSMTHGVDVVYFTMEMDEDSLTDRVDANLLGIDINDLPNIPKDRYVQMLEKKLGSFEKLGTLTVKEYPTSGVSVNEFRAFLNELYLKKKIRPKLIIVDYLNICMSSRFKFGSSNMNSYTLVKAIAEELRGLAIEYNAAVLTGTQLNRDGVDNTNVSLKEISESAGLSHTVDMLFALMRTEEFDKINQVIIKQLKNRFADMTKLLRFNMGVDRSKFRYFQTEQIEQHDNESGKAYGESSTTSVDEPEQWSGNFGVKRKPNRNFSGINT